MARIRTFAPTRSEAIVSANGAATEPFRIFLLDIQKTSRDQIPFMDDLPASPTNEQIATAFNQLLTELIALKLMKDN